MPHFVFAWGSYPAFLIAPTLTAFLALLNLPLLCHL